MKNGSAKAKGLRAEVLRELNGSWRTSVDIAEAILKTKKAPHTETLKASIRLHLRDLEMSGKAISTKLDGDRKHWKAA